MRLSRVDLAIMDALIKAGGEYKSLAKLTDCLDLEYSNARQRLYRLETAGVLTVRRGPPGKPLLIRAVSMVPNFKFHGKQNTEYKND